MDAVRSAALDLAPVAAVLAVLLLSWLWSAALHGRHRRVAPVPPRAGPAIPGQRAHEVSGLDETARR